MNSKKKKLCLYASFLIIIFRYLILVISYYFQIDSDIESDTSVFDVKSPTRENGRRSSTSTNNNNPLPGDTTPTPGSPTKAVRSNSESQNTPEKKCVTTMSGNNIAWYYQNFRFEFRSSLKNLWDSAQRFWWIPHPIEKWSEELTSNEPWNDALTEDKLQWGIKLSIRITIKKKHLMRWHRSLKRYHFKKVIKILWLFFLSRINERQSKRPRENFKRENQW